jgi:membrane fusion protein (multidrug efflux system)
MAGIMRQTLVLGLLVGAGYGGYLAFERYAVAEDVAPSRARPAPVVEVAEVRAAEIERSVSAVGSGSAVRSVELKMLASGRVEHVGFVGGELVEAGAVLVRLDDDSARAALTEAVADLTEARGAFGRSEVLRAQGRVAEAALESAQANLSRAEARVLRAETDLANRSIVAPFDGVIGFPDVEVGSSVGTDTIIAGLDDLSRLSVEFSVPERFFGDVREGARLRAESSIFPGEIFEGAVSGVGRRLDLVSRTFEVRALIDNPGRRLPAGAFLRVELVFDKRQSAIVPEEAVISRNDRSFVFVVEDGKAVERSVELGTRQVGSVEVLSGISAGEKVIVRGTDKVRNGAAVRLPGEGGQGQPGGNGPRTS